MTSTISAEQVLSTTKTDILDINYQALALDYAKEQFKDKKIELISTTDFRASRETNYVYPLGTSFSEQTRAVSTDNHTQLCLDFIQNNYLNYTIEIIYSTEEITEETGVIYTIVKAEYTLDDGGTDIIVVSLNHDTGHIEEGRSQISNDYSLYISNLPEPYSKMDWNSRKGLIKEFGHLPSEDIDISNWFCTAKFWVNPDNINDLLIQLNKSSNEYNSIITFENYTIITFENISLRDSIELANEDYVNSARISNLYEKPYYAFVQYIMIPIIIIAGLLIIKYIKKAKQSDKKVMDKANVQNQKGDIDDKY